MNLLSGWVDAGQTAATFWDQTPATHAAIMEGCLRRERRAIERDVALAWRIANFGNAGPKLKGLASYLDDMKPQHPNSNVIEAVAAFQSLAKRGLVTVREVPKKGVADAE